MLLVSTGCTKDECKNRQEERQKYVRHLQRLAINFLLARYWTNY